jgi:hypothetical protein
MELVEREVVRELVVKVLVLVGVLVHLLICTLDFFLHNGFDIFNYAGLSSSVHYCLYIFFWMNRFPSKVFL